MQQEARDDYGFGLQKGTKNSFSLGALTCQKRVSFGLKVDGKELTIKGDFLTPQISTQTKIYNAYQDLGELTQQHTLSLSLSLPLSCVKYNGKNCLKIWFKQTYMSCFELEGLKHKNPFEAVRRGPREKGQICNTSTKGLRRTRLSKI